MLYVSLLKKQFASKELPERRALKLLKKARGQMTMDEMREYVGFINAATGRGTVVPKMIEGLLPLMNVTMFSPRLAISRFETVGRTGRAFLTPGSKASRMIVKDMNSLEQIVGLTDVGSSLVTAVWDSASGVQIIAGNVGTAGAGIKSINDNSQAVGAADYPDPPGGFRSEAVFANGAKLVNQ